MKTKKIQIKNLKVGQKIKTIDENGQIVYKTVTDIWSTDVPHKDQIYIKFSNDTELECSANHPIMVKTHDGFEQKLPENLEHSDLIISDNGATSLKQIITTRNNDTTYIDITVEDTHTFFASASNEGPMVLTHNSQGGIRNASCTVTFPIWHYQFEDLIVLKNNQGTEETRVRQMDYSVVLNAMFWRRFKNGENITLFDPHEVPDLYEAFYRNTEEFETLYLQYEQDKAKKKKILSANEVFKNGILKERTDTGRIYLVNIDNVISQGPFDTKVDPIYQSNLCMEILLPTYPFQRIEDEGEFQLTLDDGKELTLPGEHLVLLTNGTRKKVRELDENDDIEDLMI
jgi:Ribonucleotide reductase, barrel domain/Pretoxin HINT domain